MSRPGDAVAGAGSERNLGWKSRRLALGLAGTLALGFSVGFCSSWTYPGGGVTRVEAASLRVGSALSAPDVPAPEGAWQELAQDVWTVRAALAEEERAVFDLVVARRGLLTRGRADVAAVGRACRRLRWSSCERVLLGGSSR